MEYTSSQLAMLMHNWLDRPSEIAVVYWGDDPAANLFKNVRHGCRFVQLINHGRKILRRGISLDGSAEAVSRKQLERGNAEFVSHDVDPERGEHGMRRFVDVAIRLRKMPGPVASKAS